MHGTPVQTYTYTEDTTTAQEPHVFPNIEVTIMTQGPDMLTITEAITLVHWDLHTGLGASTMTQEPYAFTSATHRYWSYHSYTVLI